MDMLAGKRKSPDERQNFKLTHYPASESRDLPLELRGRVCQVRGMNDAELRLSYRPDDEWLGQLDASVVSRAFSGRGSAWFNKKEVKQTFVAALRMFPLSTVNPPLIEGGFWSKEKPVTLDQCHLRIAVRPYNVRGTLVVQVDLASESRSIPDKDLQQSATARFLAEYAAVDAFAVDLEQVLDGNRELAVLRGLGR